jgi:hypothetical protein
MNFRAACKTIKARGVRCGGDLPDCNSICLVTER